jgi:hypothetical protein
MEPLGFRPPRTGRGGRSRRLVSRRRQRPFAGKHHLVSILRGRNEGATYGRSEGAVLGQNECEVHGRSERVVLGRSEGATHG